MLQKDQWVYPCLLQNLILQEKFLTFYIKAIKAKVEPLRIYLLFITVNNLIGTLNLALKYDVGLIKKIAHGLILATLWVEFDLLQSQKASLC
jgi:hypothetical protein